MSVTETEDLYRLYRREWVTVHTASTGPGSSATICFELARQWAASNLSGRVPDTDVRLQLNTDLPSLDQNPAARFWCHVQVLRDNLKGEFKHRSGAERWAKTQDYDEYVIVVRNSKQDHEIRNYGVKKL